MKMYAFNKFLAYLLYAIVLGLIFKPDQVQGQIKVMTFNIRLDHAGDGEHNWQFRKSEASELINQKQVDIVGTQEVLKNQLDDLLTGCSSYASVGVGRFDGKEAGEYSAILYRRERFEVLESGNFWLSERPDVAGSKGWDAACERVVSWAKFKDLKSGKQFVFLNTHFDHIGVEARKKSALLLLAKAKMIAGELPVILTGDFNGTPDSEPVKLIINSGWLADAGKLARLSTGPQWSFHDFGRLAVEQRPLIDFIFVTDHFEVMSYENIFAQIGNTFHSDHNPILVELQFN